jgi:Holliday junction resolvasome RuvABC ATP-dependent DNA helicase subunit
VEDVIEPYLLQQGFIQRTPARPHRLLQGLCHLGPDAAAERARPV